MSAGAALAASGQRIGRRSGGASHQTSGKASKAAMPNSQAMCRVAADAPALRSNAAAAQAAPISKVARSTRSSAAAPATNGAARHASSSRGASSSRREMRSYSSRVSGFDSSRVATALGSEPSKKVLTTCDSADARTSLVGDVGR